MSTNVRNHNSTLLSLFASPYADFSTGGANLKKIQIVKPKLHGSKVSRESDLRSVLIIAMLA